MACMIAWGQEYECLKKWSDLMTINITVANSRKISLPEIIKKITIYISSFKI